MIKSPDSKPPLAPAGDDVKTSFIVLKLINIGTLFKYPLYQ